MRAVSVLSEGGQACFLLVLASAKVSPSLVLFVISMNNRNVHVFFGCAQKNQITNTSS